jgi:hypothetical protein
LSNEAHAYDQSDTAAFGGGIAWAFIPSVGLDLGRWRQQADLEALMVAMVMTVYEFHILFSQVHSEASIE